MAKPKDFHAGAHSVFRLVYHIVLTTHRRRKLFVENEVKAFIDGAILVGSAKSEHIRVIDCAIMPEHIHILVEIPPTMTIIQYIAEVKSTIVRVARQAGIDVPKVLSRSYFVATVSPHDGMDKVRKYIQNQ